MRRLSQMDLWTLLRDEVNGEEIFGDSLSLDELWNKRQEWRESGGKLIQFSISQPFWKNKAAEAAKTLQMGLDLI